MRNLFTYLCLFFCFLSCKQASQQINPKLNVFEGFIEITCNCDPLAIPLNTETEIGVLNNDKSKVVYAQALEYIDAIDSLSIEKSKTQNLVFIYLDTLEITASKFLKNVGGAFNNKDTDKFYYDFSKYIPSSDSLYIITTQDKEVILSHEGGWLKPLDIKATYFYIK